jgi:hypothetical protein
LTLALGACGTGNHRNPVGSDEELGHTRGVEEEAKPATYVTRDGDTLRSIAARPEIYGDADLWPLLLDANAEALGSKSPGKVLAEGSVLKVPRSLSVEMLDEAREKAQQVAAAAKSARRPKTPALEPTAAPTAVSTKAPAQAAAPTPAEPRPVPKAKSGGGMLPILLLLLLVLAALGGVLYVFSRKDKQDRA